MSPDAPEPPDAESVEESVLRRKLLTVPAAVVEKALTLYVILTDSGTPAWVRALVLGALAYLINPLDACPDVLPGIGLADDLAILALALERLSRYVTPEVEGRVKRLMPRWLTGDETQTEEDNLPGDDPDEFNEKGNQDDAKKEEEPNGSADASRANRRGRFHIL